MPLPAVDALPWLLPVLLTMSVSLNVLNTYILAMVQATEIRPIWDGPGNPFACESIQNHSKSGNALGVIVR